MTSRRLLGVGLVLTVAYVVAVTATVHTRVGHVRPLYDGFTPPPPYNWVNPPAAFKSGNQKATGGQQDFGFGDADQQEAATEDAQVLVTFLLSGVPRTPGATGIRFSITPLDAATLGSVPSGYRPDGNAYHVTMTYRSSGSAVPALDKPGNIFVTYPTTADRVGYSADGKTWQLLKGTKVGSNPQLGTEFTKSGYYEAVAPGNAPLKKRSNGSGVVTGLLVMAAVAFVIFTPLVVLFVRRRPGARPAKRSKPRRGPPPRRRR